MIAIMLKLYEHAGKTRRGHEENEAKLFCWDSFYFNISNTVAIILFEKNNMLKKDLIDLYTEKSNMLLKEI